MNLYNLERHESLIQLKWNPHQLEDYSQYILAKTISSFSNENYWPVHPLDATTDKIPSIGFNDFYFGAGGIFWALDYFKTKHDLNYEEFYHNLKFDSEDNISLFFDRIAFLLFKEKISPSTENRELLYQQIKNSPNNDLNEILYGTPSTMLVAFNAFKLTGDERFKNVFQMLKENLISKWKYEEKYQCHLWTQHFAESRHYIGAAHGTFGNLQVLLRAKELLNTDELKSIEVKTSDTFQKLASTTEEYANWPTLADSEQKFLLHWCHGAPGAICALADQLPRTTENNNLILKSGELVWHAGPLKKGTSLCHGTSGNALAFLKIFKRTQDEKWLERAKAFSMHCLKQCEDLEKNYGQLRFSLWTGDLGLVWLNEQIKNHTADMPLLDVY